MRSIEDIRDTGAAWVSEAELALLCAFAKRAETSEMEAARLTRERDEARAEAKDHHFHSRGLPVRTPDEIREYINSDHPCCIGVGDACALLAEVARLERLIVRYGGSEAQAEARRIRGGRDGKA